MSVRETAGLRVGTDRRNTKRWAPRARSIASCLGLALPLAAACATTSDGPPATNSPDASSSTSHDAQPDTGGSSSSGGGSGSSSGSSGGSSSGSGGSSSGGSNSSGSSSGGAVDSSVPPSHPCTTNATLPYAVDGNGATQPAFISSGYEGDYCAIVMPGTPGACPGHTLAGALGNCWSVTVFQPAVPCGANPFLDGWAGVEWQYPANNWTDPSTMGGLNMCGATKVSFWAAGATGTELVTFFAGNMGYSASLANQTLSTTFTKYTMTLGGMPDSNVSVGFGWSTAEPTVDGGVVVGDGAAPDAGARDGGGIGATDSGVVGPTVKFMIDNIQWQ
jgi:hypothetical protein